MSAPAPSRRSAALALEQLTAEIRSELYLLLDDVGGQICLVLDRGIGGQLDHVVPGGAEALRSHGVRFVRSLRPELDAVREHRVVYLVRPTVAAMMLIAGHVMNENMAEVTPRRFHGFMVPRTTVLCTHVLEEAGVLPHVRVGAYRLDAIALDTDVLSLELPDSLREVAVDGDPTALECVTQFLLRFEQLYGTPREVRTFGTAARGVAERLARADLRAERARCRARSGGDGVATAAGPRDFGGVLPQCNLSDAADARARRDVDTLVIIDRLADLVTPMVTPLTYEGLVDEVMGGIHHGCARLPRAVVADDADETASAAAADADGDRVAYALNSRDALYAEVRDLNIEELGARLGDRAKAIRAACDTA